MTSLRPAQEEIVNYAGGRMGISAVPGSGKTYTLSWLAARLIEQADLFDDQEVLIVTLVNSAVDNFSTRISGFLRDKGLIPNLGYRVRTLHGLAHDIVRERPDLVGLSDHFTIVDERESQEIMDAAVASWLRIHPEFITDWSAPDVDLNSSHYTQKHWIDLVDSLARSFIRQAKDLQLLPADLQRLMQDINEPHPLLQLGLEIYTDYQRSLNYRSAVDFSDLIRLALLALQSDPDYQRRLHYRWPYILEDEAQDSSSLQEQILRSLVGLDGNWVRVGDPNQAIYETFTTASPRFLRDFLREPDVAARNLPNSGRSTRSIIHLANSLIEWTNAAHPVPELRDALTRPYIQPTPPGDPQPNPPDDPNGIFIMPQGYEAEKEIESVAISLKRWLPEHSDWTVAVLTSRNERGAKIVEELKKRDIPYVELLQSSQSTRSTADILAACLRSLADPGSATKLQDVLKRLGRIAAGDDKAMVNYYRGAVALLDRCPRLEDYLAPLPDSDWLAALPSDQVADEVRQILADFRDRIVRWQKASLLPVDQLLLTISQELFTNAPDLALAHKLALLLERAAANHPEWQLIEFAEELSSVARNERKLPGFSEEDTGFDPDRYKGKVVVATLHKAKGLEWDRVYLLSANNYDFPSAQPYDNYISEKWFVRDRLNLEAEALARLKALADGDLEGVYIEDGPATRAARLEYSSERLRVLYVGITRARRELVVTWNTGRRGDSQQALPILALQSGWKGNV
ncbi:superfamily I DNA and RNA helicase [Longilinea arvoryzae]|uniref:DNA 3'-5' helicase n=1 Tax=Longilinea arvoryzae TaxID=360412 RepID=A0A0S7BH94_9CHLR|nr:ATP-dependent helicase [Longilinea arvoryzae]GAP15021.1 superfamily I DNA and RNA helicase [Longilinea arvoryzae]